MAAVQKISDDSPTLVSPPGETVIDKGRASADIMRGDPVIILATTPPSALWEQVVGPATGAFAHGIALKTCKAGGTVEYACQGEMDGFVGLTRGASLTIAAGVLDDTPATVESQARIRAVTSGRIRFSLI